ncbi:hypothetical protein [Pantoea deleyi]|uniref:hypothetical protein n=1 Tax=Pantoea deleyi TaxID=470932 RepID=UPI000FE13EBF|nr:hypothetical protein [Pantoea deleyi]
MTPACCDNVAGFALPARLLLARAEKIVKKTLEIRTVMAGRRRSPLSEKEKLLMLSKHLLFIHPGDNLSTLG